MFRRTILLFLLSLPLSSAPGDDTATEPPPTSSILPSSAAAIIPIAPEKPVAPEGEGIQWRPVLNQSALLLGISEGFRLATQADTRKSLKGPFFKDYIESLKGLGGWGDDDPPIANYVAHPMQGSICTWIVVHNDPKGARLEFQMTKPYWVSRLKGMGFSAAYSAFYEVGPLGDAAIGNLGMRRDYKGMVDIVITPTVGLGWNLTEDMLDHYFIRWVEAKTGNSVINALVRTWLNPTRGFANIIKFRRPWERDSRPGLYYIRYQHRYQNLSPAPGG